MARSSSLRHLKRIANKTRLRIYRGDIDSDQVQYEDDPTSIQTWSTSGVDQDDANEHHLQAVLLLHSFLHLIPLESLTTMMNSTLLFVGQIPQPTFVPLILSKSSPPMLLSTVSQARGEGTSAQGAASGATTRSSSSSRSAKAKGKEPDVAHPISISEDEFELVMGVFEKVTHEKTEYLHHGLETGMSFPAFSDYQETFSSPLPPSTFADFTVPTWVPPPSQLIRIARILYTHWKERRLERDGHRIIPTLNFDEADTLNESYICFRRREIKAVRKTRASQVTSSDKLMRLNSEIALSLELAKSSVTRENLKRDLLQQCDDVWDKRYAVANLRSQIPSLGDKADDELLFDKERPPKKPEPPRLPNLKLRGQNELSPLLHSEATIRPKDRLAMIQSQIERELLRQKDRDHHWEDQVDNLYQQQPVPFPSRLFKYMPPPYNPSWRDSLPSSPSSTLDVDIDRRSPIQPRSVRLRLGRGGRLLVDRRSSAPRQFLSRQSRRSTAIEGESDEIDDDEERKWRLLDRWKYDMDDGPAVGPEGLDEQDRILVDDYEPKYLRHTMTLLADGDQQSLMTDPTIMLTGTDGRQQPVIPFRLGMQQQPVVRRDAQGRPYSGPGMGVSMSPMISAIAVQAQAQAQAQAAQAQAQALSLLNAASNNGMNATALDANLLSIQAQAKKMPPPVSVPQMRISSNGGMRPLTSTNGVSPVTPNTTPASQTSPNHNTQQHQLPSNPMGHGNGVNGINRPAMNMPHLDVMMKPDVGIQNAVQVHGQQDVNSIPMSIDGSPTRPKSQNQAQSPNLNQGHIVSTNGYHLPTMNVNGYSPTTQYLQQQQQQQQHNGLSIQQMQNIKSAFANMPSQDINVNGLSVNGNGRGVPASYMHGGNFNMPNINLKLPAARQMQWATVSSPLQRPASTVNGHPNNLNGNGNGMDVVMNGSSLSPNGMAQQQQLPVRTPSRSGGLRGVGHVISGHHAMSMSPHLQHSPSPMPMTVPMSQSPPRPPPTPTMMMASPPGMQQPVGSAQGY